MNHETPTDKADGHFSLLEGQVGEKIEVKADLP